MVNPQMVMYEEEFNQIQTVVDRLVREANAKVVFIVDKNGQLIAASGEVDNIDTTSLASLTAGNIAAMGCRNSCATVAMKMSFRRSASRSARCVRSSSALLYRNASSRCSDAARDSTS